MASYSGSDPTDYGDGNVGHVNEGGTGQDPAEKIASTVKTQAPVEARDPFSVGTPPGGIAANKYSPRGKGKSFTAEKYNVGNYSYPSDLHGSPEKYGYNQVVFYINVSTDSKMVREGKEEFVDDIDPRDRGDLVANKYSATEVGIGTAVIGSGIGSAVGLAGGNAAKGGLIGAGIGAASVAAVATQSPGFTRAQKRLKTAIAMHVPNNLTISYGTQYAEDDTAALSTAMEAARVMGDTLKPLLDNPSLTGIKDAISAGKEGFKNLGAAGTALGLSLAPAGVGAMAGLAANPKKEQVFKGVDFRTFTFDYQFYPRDEKEAANVMNIIKQFKYHMHPEFKDSGNFIYIYPSEFDVAYYYGPIENRHIHRHTSCVLTNMTVNYTPNAQFTTFRGGMPTQINIALTFRELGLLTKDKIEDGM